MTSTFYIITLDRDLGDPSPYKNIATNTWTSDENGTKIYYINPNFKIRELIKVVNQIDYDVLYLNSFFNFRFTIIPLFLNKFHFFKKSKPIVLAHVGNCHQVHYLSKNARKRYLQNSHHGLGSMIKTLSGKGQVRMKLMIYIHS